MRLDATLWALVAISNACFCLVRGLRPQDQRHKLLHSTVSSESPLAPGVVVTVEGANAGPHTTDVDENGKVTVRVNIHLEGDELGGNVLSSGEHVNATGVEAKGGLAAVLGCRNLHLPPMNKSDLRKLAILAKTSDSAGKKCDDAILEAPPELDDTGFLAPGPWYDCLHAAVAWEHENPEWSRMPEFDVQGPAGMVADLFLKRAEESEFILEECMHRMEKDAHMLLPNSTHLVKRARLNEQQHQQSLIKPPKAAVAPVDTKDASARIKHIY
mmetsp:Transcript_6443/g.15648  ORF Transcript_6443/g.15648 Transcript_6443/m.15648 type:complete len:271 (+) Transcript_6443:99-911(+)